MSLICRGADSIVYPQNFVAWNGPRSPFYVAFRPVIQTIVVYLFPNWRSDRTAPIEEFLLCVSFCLSSLLITRRPLTLLISSTDKRDVLFSIFRVIIVLRTIGRDFVSVDETIWPEKMSTSCSYFRDLDKCQCAHIMNLEIRDSFRDLDVWPRFSLFFRVFSTNWSIKATIPFLLWKCEIKIGMDLIVCFLLIRKILDLG